MNVNLNPMPIKPSISNVERSILAKDHADFRAMLINRKLGRMVSL